ncbi:MAG: CZB domain-containing protein, partial [Pseudomonadota bacterium]
MIDKEKLDKAINDHKYWIVKLANAINQGKCDISTANVKSDRNCEFGKWLYGELQQQQHKGTPLFKEIKEIHAKFHNMAALILDLAL